MPPTSFKHDKYNFKRFTVSVHSAAANNGGHNAPINSLLSENLLHEEILLTMFNKILKY